MSSYAIVFEPPVRLGGNWGAYVPDLPGCVSTGDTLDECRTTIREAIEFHIQGLRAARVRRTASFRPCRDSPGGRMSRYAVV